MSRMKMALLAFATIALTVVSQLRAAAEVELTLMSPQTAYKIGEPIKLVVEIHNTSTDTLHVASVAHLNMNMDFMHYELTVPDGSLELTKSHFFTYFKNVDPMYGGEPLAPGARITVFLYPRQTLFRTDEESYATERRMMFRDPGTYSLRVVYRVPLVYDRLRSLGPGELTSNPVVLQFEEPNEIDREILAACWTPRNVGALLGEMNAHAEFDVQELRRVIAKYPAHPLVAHAEFALARTLSRLAPDGLLSTASEGVELLRHLKRTSPSFRSEEVHKQLAIALFYSGNRVEALQVFEEGLNHHGRLEGSFAYMTRYLYARTGDNRIRQKLLRERMLGSPSKGAREGDG